MPPRLERVEPAAVATELEGRKTTVTEYAWAYNIANPPKMKKEGNQAQGLSVL
jgi:hypothetical protein